MTGVVVASVLALTFYLVGAWGLRNAPDLVPAGLSEERRAKDVRAMRRGAKTCYVVATFFAVMGALSIVELARGA